MALEYRPVVMGRHVNLVAEREATQFDRRDGLFGREPQFRRWASRLTKHFRFFSRFCVPIHNGEQAVGLRTVRPAKY